MGLLYPRLLTGRARPMHEEYKALTIAELTTRAADTHPAAIYVATGGARVFRQRLVELREIVVDLAKDAGFPGESNREARAAFDLKLGAALHSEMGMVPAEAASGDVWAFLALVLLPDIAYWRYPRPPGDRILGTDLTRHVFGRMWWRAQLIHSPDAPQPYAALNVLGEAAFDQIYARRKALGGSPHLVKGILRVWGGLDLRGLDEREALRDFLKRLLRLAPFVLFEALGEDELDAELRAAAEESVNVMRPTAWPAPEAVPQPTRFRAAPPPVPDSRPERPAPLRSADAAYRPYDGPGFGDPRDLGLQARAEAITAVVTVEGPVKALRVYRIITHAAGNRLRENAQDALIAATKYAVRKGMIQAENQLGRNGYAGATLRLTTQPICVLRHRGPRDLDEIPDRELAVAAAVIRSVDPDLTGDLLAKETSMLFGYERATSRFKEALTDALEKYGS